MAMTTGWEIVHHKAARGGVSMTPAHFNSMTWFYLDYIDNEIEWCRQKATRLESEGEALFDFAQLALKQLDFYRNNRERLAARMEEQNLGINRNQMDYFLIKSFWESLSASQVN
jgi:hypothetical protein